MSLGRQRASFLLAHHMRVTFPRAADFCAFACSSSSTILEWKERPQFHPLSPDMKMHILLTVLYTFRMDLGRRICLNAEDISSLVIVYLILIT